MSDPSLGEKDQAKRDAMSVNLVGGGVSISNFSAHGQANQIFKATATAPPGVLEDWAAAILPWPHPPAAASWRAAGLATGCLLRGNRGPINIHSEVRGRLQFVERGESELCSTAKKTTSESS